MYHVSTKQQKPGMLPKSMSKDVLITFEGVGGQQI